MSFLVAAAVGQTSFGIVTNAENPSTLTVSFGSTVLLDEVPIPAGYAATLMPLTYAPEEANFTVVGIAEGEIVKIISA